jgi:3-isopropylmalate dehydrogenase
LTISIVTLPGDGIGPEVAAQAIRVLLEVSNKIGFNLTIKECSVGGSAIDQFGVPLPGDTLKACANADAIFLGAVGGPEWKDVDVQLRPEQGLLDLRKSLGLFANLRPVTTQASLSHLTPFKTGHLSDLDIMVVRELTGGLYFGKRGRTSHEAYDTCVYTVPEIERIARLAGQLAQSRKHKVTSVDKANVLDTSRLWRETVERVFENEFPEINLEHIYVDAAAMYLISRPETFDVILTENMFGDILSDEASMLAGSLGLLPSASLGAKGPGLFEPIHGSAPDIAGKGIANPCGAILSIAMMLRHTLNMPAAANAVEKAVTQTLSSGTLTADLTENSNAVSTEDFGGAVIDALVLQ